MSRKIKPREKEKEYSKRKLSAIIALWFIGAVFGMLFCTVQLVVSPESASLDGLLTYIGAPMSCGIVTYLIKSAMENKEKIKRNCGSGCEDGIGENDISNDSEEFYK